VELCVDSCALLISPSKPVGSNSSVNIGAEDKTDDARGQILDQVDY
jgi:hypothetical protein